MTTAARQRANQRDRCGIDAAVDAARRGEPFLLTGTGVGHLVLAAEHATWRPIAFMVRHTSGYLSVAGPPERWDHLGIPRMPYADDRPEAAYGISVDAREGVTTGISARDRALTIRLLADPNTDPEDLARPGHVVTLRTRQRGVLAHRGCPEAVVDLMRLAGLQPLGAIGAVVRDDGPAAGQTDLADLARDHELVTVGVDEVPVGP